MTNQERIRLVSNNLREKLGNENTTVDEASELIDKAAAILLDLTPVKLRRVIKLFHPSALWLEHPFDEDEPVLLFIKFEPTGSAPEDYDGGYLTIIPETGEIEAYTGSIPALIVGMLNK